MPDKDTLANYIINTLWPDTESFNTEWGSKSREGLAESIETLIIKWLKEKD